MIYEPVLILKPEMVKIDETARVDSFVKIEGGQGVDIGAYVHIASFVHINSGGGTTIISDHAGIATGAKILSGSPDLSFLPICPNELPEDVHPLRYTTTIGKYAFIAANAVVMPGVTVGTGAVVAAGAVATKDIPDWEIWASIPARKIGIRTASERGLAESDHQL